MTGTSRGRSGSPRSRRRPSPGSRCAEPGSSRSRRRRAGARLLVENEPREFDGYDRGLRVDLGIDGVGSESGACSRPTRPPGSRDESTPSSTAVAPPPVAALPRRRRVRRPGRSRAGPRDPAVPAPTVDDIVVGQRAVVRRRGLPAHRFHARRGPAPHAGLRDLSRQRPGQRARRGRAGPRGPHGRARGPARPPEACSATSPCVTRSAGAGGPTAPWTTRSRGPRRAPAPVPRSSRRRWGCPFDVGAVFQVPADVVDQVSVRLRLSGGQERSAAGAPATVTPGPSARRPAAAYSATANVVKTQPTARSSAQDQARAR